MMGKVDYSVVLSDELLDQFYLFKKNGHYDEKLVQRLLRYYKPLYLTNISQLERIGHEPDPTLRINLLKSDYKSQSLEELRRLRAEFAGTGYDSGDTQMTSGGRKI